MRSPITSPGSAIPMTPNDMAKFWPADLHLIGKDIVRFHAVYWPAFLMSAGLPCPSRSSPTASCSIAGRRRASRSAMSPIRVSWRTRYGVDVLRYFLLREFSFGQDGSYSREAIVSREQFRTGQQLRQSRAADAFADVQELRGLLPADLRPHRCRRRAVRPRRTGGAARNARTPTPISRLRRRWKRGWGRCSPATPISMPKPHGRSRRPIPSGCRPCWPRSISASPNWRWRCIPVMPGSMAKLLDAMGIAPELRTPEAHRLALVFAAGRKRLPDCAATGPVPRLELPEAEEAAG